MLAKRHWSLHLWSLCCSWLAEENLAFVHKAFWQSQTRHPTNPTLKCTATAPMGGWTDFLGDLGAQPITWRFINAVLSGHKDVIKFKGDDAVIIGPEQQKSWKISARMSSDPCRPVMTWLTWLFDCTLENNQNSTCAEASTTSHVTYVPNRCTCHILHFEKRDLMSTCFDLQGGLVEHDMSSYDIMRSCWSRLVVPCFNVLQLDMICYQDRKYIYKCPPWMSSPCDVFLCGLLDHYP